MNIIYTRVFYIGYMYIYIYIYVQYTIPLCKHYINAILYVCIYIYIQHVAMGGGQNSANSVQDTLTGIHKAPCLAGLLDVETVEATNLSFGTPRMVSLLLMLGTVSQ